MNHSGSKVKSTFMGLAGVIILTCLDQFTKYLAVAHLRDKPPVVLIPGVFELTYLENRGAAWGMFENFQWLFLIFTVILLAALVYCYIKTPMERQYRAFRILAVILSAGAAGNAIDRAVQGYVVDFFYLSLIDFPVFNVADCYVTFSLVLFLLVYRREVVEWIRKE